MVHRRIRGQAGFIAGLSGVGHSPALIVGRRYFWNMGPRRAPDLAAEALALFFPVDRRPLVEGTVWGSSHHRRHYQHHCWRWLVCGHSGPAGLRRRSWCGPAHRSFHGASHLARARTPLERPRDQNVLIDRHAEWAARSEWVLAGFFLYIAVLCTWRGRGVSVSAAVAALIPMVLIAIARGDSRFPRRPISIVRDVAPRRDVAAGYSERHMGPTSAPDHELERVLIVWDRGVAP